MEENIVRSTNVLRMNLFIYNNNNTGNSSLFAFRPFRKEQVIM
jgi:hypothetical protein